MNHIVIIGFMGSGKTRVGKRIAKDLNLTFVDLDKRISDHVKMSTAEFFRKFEEPFYRAEETFMVKELLEENQRLVISLGAAFPLQEQNEEYLRKLGTVVYLKGTPSTILERLRAGADNILTRGEVTEERIVRMLEMRDPIYQQFADVQVMTGVKSFEDLVQDIENKIAKFDPEKRTVTKVNFRTIHQESDPAADASEDEKKQEAQGTKKTAHKAPAKKAAALEAELKSKEGLDELDELTAKAKPARKRSVRKDEKAEEADGLEGLAMPDLEEALEKPVRKSPKTKTKAVSEEEAEGGQEAGSEEEKPAEAPKKKKPATKKKAAAPEDGEEESAQEETPKKKTRTSKAKKTADAQESESGAEDSGSDKE